MGNFALPLVAENPDIHVYACDFAERAISLLQADPRCQAAGKRCTAFVADLAQPGSLSAVVPDHSIDIVTCIFVLSALPPESFQTAIQNIRRVLRPGGLALVRDYSQQDAALARFSDDRRLDEYLCVRQDGTLAYYFGQEELCSLFAQESFVATECTLIHAKTTNVRRDLDLDRYFVQGKFQLVPEATPSNGQ